MGNSDAEAHVCVGSISATSLSALQRNPRDRSALKDVTEFLPTLDADMARYERSCSALQRSPCGNCTVLGCAHLTLASTSSGARLFRSIGT